ncbi:MAG: site-specific integrase [Desulfobacterales bacterium]|nr:site-specific integrase [Desulfobacterales bacterium]
MNTKKSQLEDYLQKYLTYLRIEKNCSQLTFDCYRTELQKFIIYLGGKIQKISDVKIDVIH